MADDRKAQLLEKYDDAVLSLLMDNYADLDGQRLWTEFENAKIEGKYTAIDPHTDRKSQKLIHRFYSKNTNQLWEKHCVKFLAKTAAIVLVLLLVPTVIVLSVEAFRVPVLNFIIDRGERFATITFDSSMITESVQEQYFKQFEHSLPEGYTIIQSSIDASSAIVYSTTQDGDVLLFSILDTGSTISIDADTLDYTEVSIGEQQVMFSDSDGLDLIWLDEKNNSICNIYASGIDVNTFWEIAASLITYS